MTLSYTTRFRMGIPDFLSAPWHSEFASAVESIDKALYEALTTVGSDLWQNDSIYIKGDTVIDSSTGSMFICTVAHTSSSVVVAPTLADERALHPTYWATPLLAGASQVEAEAGTENSKFMSALRTAQAISVQVAPRGPGVGFSAHRNGVSYGGFTHAAIRKVVFTTTAYDPANDFDVVNSRWTPPAGLVCMSAGIGIIADIGPLNNGHLTIYLYKNNTAIKQAFFNHPSGLTSDVTITANDYANGTDYYEIFISSPSLAGTYAVKGDTTASFFMGHVVAAA